MNLKTIAANVSKSVGFRANVAPKTAELYIYDEIAPWAVSAIEVARVLATVTADEIKVHINSPGGLVHEGMAIYNALSQHAARVVVEVDGLAASIASVIAMAGDEIRIAENARFMIHDPWSGVIGTAEDLRKEADVIDALKADIVATYVARTGLDAERIASMMSDETWLSGAEAVNLKFASALIPLKSVPKEATDALRNFDLSGFKKTPANFGADAPAPNEGTPMSVNTARLALRSKINHQQ